MAVPADAPAKIAAKVASGDLPLNMPRRLWAGTGTGQPCHGCGEVIGPSTTDYEFEAADGRTIHLHVTCASLLEAERRRRTGPA